MGTEKNAPANTDRLVHQGMLGQNLVFPQGTRDELIETGMSPARIGSCSKPGKGNLGCEYFNICRFKQWRDGYKGLKGPLNIGVRKIMSAAEGGAFQESQIPCHGWYKCGFDAQQKDMDVTGTVVQIIAYEGDGKKIKERCTRKDTRKGADTFAAEQYIDEHEVMPFVRPAEKFQVQGMAQKALEELMAADERDALRDALEKHNVGGKE